MKNQTEKYLKPLPMPDVDCQPFWDSCKKHEMALQQCLSCEHFRYPPRSLCPRCHSPEARWSPLSGKGQVYASLVMCRSYGPAWEHDVPYNISLIDLEEGVRIWSNVIGCSPEDIKIGDHVLISYEDVTEDVTLPNFAKLKRERKETNNGYLCIPWWHDHLSIERAIIRSVRGNGRRCGDPAKRQ